MSTPNSIITPQTPNVVVGQSILTANTAKDGTGTVVTLYTAGSSGSKVDGVYISYTGTSVATVLRLFINNGATSSTATNNTLIKSVSVPANTLSEVAAASDFFAPLGITLPAGYKILATIGTTVASALSLCSTGGDL